MKKVSALIFLVGAMAMVCGAVWVWMYILTTIAKDYGPGFAFAALVLSAVFIKFYWDWIAAPWRAWMALWNDFDRRLDN